MESMVKHLVLMSLMVALLLALPLTAAAQALPPSGFYGNVSAGGANVKDGTVIDVTVDGKKAVSVKTQTYQGKSVYNADVVGDAALAGKAVAFSIGTLKAKETGKWASGSNVALNLSFAALPATGDEQVPALIGMALMLALVSVGFGTMMLRRSHA